jgi:hypothetical protein
MVASAKISFTPTANNEEAGLVVRGDDANHFDLVITMIAGKRVVMLRKYLQSTVTGMNFNEIADAGDIILRVSATDLRYKFWVQEEGKTAILIGTAATKDISTEVTGGFIGAFVGMYASGNGSANSNPADFDWFDFEEDPTVPYPWSDGPIDSLNNMIIPEIIFATATSYDKVKLVWGNIANETGYIIERMVNDKFDSVGTVQANDTVFTDSGLSGSTVYIYRVKARNDNGYSYPSMASAVLTMHQPGPYFDTPSQIPGKIEAENYDYGESGETYYDTDTKNNGGEYRNDGVDISSSWDIDDGYIVGWISTGEWLLYTIDANDTIANIELRVAAWNSGGKIKIELDGTNIAEAAVPATGSWTTVKISKVKLEKGQNKRLKLTFTGSFDFNWVNFVKVNLTDINPLKDDGVSVYPNPTSNTLNIISTFKYTNIKIFNLEGKCLLSKTTPYQPENVLHFSLSDGQYILLLNNQEETKSAEFIVAN